MATLAAMLPAIGAAASSAAPAAAGASAAGLEALTPAMASALPPWLATSDVAGVVPEASPGIAGMLGNALGPLGSFLKTNASPINQLTGAAGNLKNLAAAPPQPPIMPVNAGGPPHPGPSGPMFSQGPPVQAPPQPAAMPTSGGSGPGLSGLLGLPPQLLMRLLHGGGMG